MLTADLLRATVRDDEVFPHYIRPGEPSSLELAARLIGIFEEHVGRTRRDLDDELADFLAAGTAFILHRGLAKLLLDRCEFECAAAVDPVELRRATFQTAAEAHRRPPPEPFDRLSVIEQVAEQMGIEPHKVDANLLGDLKEEHVLRSMRPISPAGLIDRYNVALAQAVLLRATQLDIEISGQNPRRYRELFRAIKFFQLLHTVAGSSEAGYRIRLDGPLSLFSASQRYGMQMASFLPTLLRFDDWRLEARVLWGKARRRCLFRLDPDAGLRSDRHLKGQWQPEEMSWLPEQFRKLESDWEISEETELIDLGGRGVVAPDYVFTHRDTGKKVYLEIFGFWRRGSLAPRLELLREHGPRNLIVAVARELHAGEEDLAGLPGEVYVFRSQPIAREVRALLEKFEGRP
ncbi:MAG: DUF790 family protein [Planctomycetes bacterium]|nr:DUF790 family protein [Planctomycetota bacterium]